MFIQCALRYFLVYYSTNIECDFKTPCRLVLVDMTGYKNSEHFAYKLLSNANAHTVSMLHFLYFTMYHLQSKLCIKYTLV